MKKVAIVAAMVLGVAGGAQAQGSASAGATKSASCTACHQQDGNSLNPIWPKLAGQHASYIAKQLSDFKSGARTDPTMNGMAAPLSEQDVLDLAAYFSEQTVAIGSADPEKAAAGKRLFQGGDPARGISACMSCHGPSGAGNPGAKFPALSGQHPDYTIKALKDFRSGTRSNDLNGMMVDVAAKMTDADIEAVAAYINGLY
ncbi:c-type cytochrome [Thiohalomonas denitrificans]|uniref:Cytochrome c553 n=1 Tax=Thiohalomonas denitrificans TaxID=415747 RepID=A0A1G5QSD3_9GAMM|nr:c-type cytochrome [Thiohalomonas denitrificans]SCZ64576.1 Cytochrome c553 [Thiohalomonas denitrificans]